MPPEVLLYTGADLQVRLFEKLLTSDMQEIVDETDRYVDNMRLQRVNAALLTSSLPKHLRK